jgi:hypothetical protein
MVTVQDIFTWWLINDSNMTGWNLYGYSWNLQGLIFPHLKMQQVNSQYPIYFVPYILHEFWICAWEYKSHPGHIGI